MIVIRGLKGVMRKPSIVIAALLLLVVAVYWPVVNYPFTGFDDEVYIRDNPAVLTGLSLAGLRWAFTTFYANFWHPLTWVSHMADVAFFGLRPGMHHLVSFALHASSTILLYLAFNAMTGSRGKSAFVAALFAIHPLHVESVAWIAERKDVLSGFFWMLSLCAYVRYARRPRLTRYLVVLVVFALGLMAKPMLVTFPFVLLLLDYWPFGRFRVRDGSGDRPPVTIAHRQPFRSLVAEKLPLLLLAAGFSVVTVISQSRGGTVQTLDIVPLWARLGNAVHSFAWYALKTAWPTALAVFYPHPGTAVVPRHVLVSASFIGAATWFVLRQWACRPALAVGWLWYLGTLVPTIGLVQIGAYARADRFTYLPLIGLFVLVAWGAPELASRLRLPAALAPWLAGAVILALTVACFNQVRYWRDDEALFGHALEATRGNWLIHGNLGATRLDRGDLEGAISQFREALRFNPSFEPARLNLGQALSLLGRDEEAESQFREVLRQRPGDGKAHFCLGRHYAARERLEEAIAQLEEAVRLSPDFAPAYELLGATLSKAGRGDEARRVREAAEKFSGQERP